MGDPERWRPGKRWRPHGVVSCTGGSGHSWPSLQAHLMEVQRQRERTGVLQKLETCDPPPLCLPPSRFNFLWCPPSFPLVGASFPPPSFSVFLRVSPSSSSHFFPDRLPFFCWPTPSLPYPRSPLSFNWPLGWAPPFPPHLHPPCVVSHIASPGRQAPHVHHHHRRGQAEFDGESPPPPRHFPQRVSGLGSDPSQEQDSYPSLCETVWC